MLRPPKRRSKQICVSVSKGREKEIPCCLKYQDYMSIITPLQEELVKLCRHGEGERNQDRGTVRGRDAAGKAAPLNASWSF